MGSSNFNAATEQIRVIFERESRPRIYETIWWVVFSLKRHHFHFYRPTSFILYITGSSRNVSETTPSTLRYEWSSFTRRALSVFGNDGGRYLSTEFPVRISLGFCMKFPVFKELRRSDCFAKYEFLSNLTLH